MKQQQLLMALMLVGVATVAPAQTTESRLVVCAGETNPQQRLACFDALAGDVGTPPGQAIEQQDMDAAVEVTPPNDEKFGLEHKTMKGELAVEMEARVTGIYKNKLGKLLLMFDNGQIWQQMDSKPMIIHEGDAIVVERGAMSAFYLTAKGKKRIRVARVK